VDNHSGKPITALNSDSYQVYDVPDGQRTSGWAQGDLDYAKVDGTWYKISRTFTVTKDEKGNTVVEGGTPVPFQTQAQKDDYMKTHPDDNIPTAKFLDARVKETRQRRIEERERKENSTERNRVQHRVTN
jgi:hypothetical protein